MIVTIIAVIAIIVAIDVGIDTDAGVLKIHKLGSKGYRKQSYSQILLINCGIFPP